MPPPRRESRSSPGGPGAPNCSSDWGSSWVAFRRIDAIMASAPNRSPQFDSFRVNSSVYALPRFKSERKSEPRPIPFGGFDIGGKHERAQAGHRRRSELVFDRALLRA